MGAWGPGNFENDDAHDWVSELCEWDSFESVHEAIEAVHQLAADDEIEAPESACALAAAEVVSAALGAPARDLPNDLATWLETHRLKVSSRLYRRTVVAIQRVKTNSELKELWDESTAAKKWQAKVADLASRLAKAETAVGKPTKGTRKKSTASDAAPAKSKRGPMTKIGDLIEIKSKCGLTYAIYTHRNKLMRDLIQIFDQTLQTRPSDLADLLPLPIRFCTFTHMPALVRSGVVSKIGNLGVPEHLQAFPLFRCEVRNFSTGKVFAWWLWDGQKEWKIGKLSSKQRKLPIRSAPSLDLLLQWLDTGWRPELDDD
jgi:hypothetical protein